MTQSDLIARQVKVLDHLIERAEKQKEAHRKKMEWAEKAKENAEEEIESLNRSIQHTQEKVDSKLVFIPSAKRFVERSQKELPHLEKLLESRKLYTEAMDEMEKLTTEDTIKIATTYFEGVRFYCAAASLLRHMEEEHMPAKEMMDRLGFTDLTQKEILTYLAAEDHPLVPPTYPAIFHPEDIGYSVSIPDFEGCFTEGDSLQEAIELARDVMALCLEDCETPPTPSDPEDLPVEPGDLVQLVSLDGQESQEEKPKEP